MSNSAMLAFSQTGSERETYRSIYVTKAEAEAAFGVALDLKPFRVHPLQPFVAGRNFWFLLVEFVRVRRLLSGDGFGASTNTTGRNCAAQHPC